MHSSPGQSLRSGRCSSGMEEKRRAECGIKAELEAVKVMQPGGGASKRECGDL